MFVISITLGKKGVQKLALKGSFGRWFGYLFHSIMFNR